MFRRYTSNRRRPGRTFQQFQDIWIAAELRMLSICNIANRAAPKFNAVARCLVWMIEFAAPYSHTGMQLHHIADLKSLYSTSAWKISGGTGKSGAIINSVKLASSVIGMQVPRPHRYLITGNKQRCKKRQPANMIEMRVGDIEVGVNRTFWHQLVSGSRIQYQHPKSLDGRHNALQGRSVSAVAHRLRPRNGDATACTPELNSEVLRFTHTSIDP